MIKKIFSSVIFAIYTFGFSPFIYAYTAIAFVITFIKKGRKNNVYINQFAIATIVLLIYIIAGKETLDIKFEIARFYLGLIGFILAVKTLRIDFTLAMRGLYVLPIYEYLHQLILGRPPHYIINYAIKNDLIYETRTQIGDLLMGGIGHRALGAALNSSISGSILAVLLIVFLDKYFLNKNHMIISNLTIYDFFGILFGFFACGSITAFLIFLIGFTQTIVQSFLRIISSKKIKYYVIFTSIILIAGFTALLNTEFARLLMEFRFSSEYINYVIDTKLMFINSGSLINELIFGRMIIAGENSFIGGDAVLINFILTFGVPLSGLYLYFTYKLFRAVNFGKYYIILTISTLHYATIFSVVGQLFLALCYAKLSENQRKQER